MSKEAAMAFREKVLERSDLQKAIRTATGGGKQWDWPAVVALGERESLSFTVDEAQAALKELDQNELSDFELELVAGGQENNAARAGGKVNDIIGIANTSAERVAEAGRRAR